MLFIKHDVIIVEENQKIKNAAKVHFTPPFINQTIDKRYK